MAQSNRELLNLIHHTEEILKGTKICAFCFRKPPEHRLVVRFDGDVPHWFCPNCGREWKERREWLGPEGTITPFDEEVVGVGVAVQNLKIQAEEDRRIFEEIDKAMVPKGSVWVKDEDNLGQAFDPDTISVETLRMMDKAAKNFRRSVLCVVPMQEERVNYGDGISVSGSTPVASRNRGDAV